MAAKCGIPVTAVSPYFDLNQDIKTIKKAALSIKTYKTGMPIENQNMQKSLIISLFHKNLSLLQENLPSEIIDAIGKTSLDRPETLTEELLNFCETI